MNNPMEDAEFEAYIRRRASLSRRYRNLALESPPPELDAAVMSLAREAHTLKRPEGREVYVGWMAPVAFAATVVLVFTVVLQVVIRPHPYATVATGEQPSNNVADSQLSRQQPPVAAAPRPAVRPESAASGALGEQRSGTVLESVAVTAARTQATTSQSLDANSEVSRYSPAALEKRAMADSEASTEPKAWLARIDELRRSGRSAAADRQMKLFLAKYPDYFRTHTPPPDSR